jgi:hypothetical protein
VFCSGAVSVVGWLTELVSTFLTELFVFVLVLVFALVLVLVLAFELAPVPEPLDVLLLVPELLDVLVPVLDDDPAGPATALVESAASAMATKNRRLMGLSSAFSDIR